MRLLHNEKGGALLYVLFVFALLCLFLPLILTTTSQSTLEYVTDRNDKIATTLANSAVETFIAYLDKVPPAQNDRKKYFEEYPGLVENLAYTLPEGVPVRYSLTRPSAATIKAHVAVGSGPARRESTVQYTFQVQNGSGGTGRANVPEEPNQILYGHEKKVQNTGVTIAKQDLQSKIEAVLNTESQRMEDYAKLYTDQAPACIPASQINSKIASGTANPVLVIAVCGNVEFETGTYVWGSESKPVVMIFESLSVKNGISLTIHGDLIVKNNLTIKNKSTFLINRTSSSQVKNGNLIVLNTLHTQNGLNLNTPDKPLRSFYAGTADFQNESNVYTDNLIVANKLHLQNGGTYESGLDIIAGEMDFQNNTTVTAKEGDLLVRDNLKVQNGGTYTAGGIIAAGYDVDIQNHLTIETGGGTSSVYGTGSGGGGTSPAPWSPVRN